MTGPSLATVPGGAWAARLPERDAASIAAMRLLPGVLARIADESDDGGDSGRVWICGAELTDSLELELRKLPGAERFTVTPSDDGDIITPVGKRIPAGKLPAGGWTPIGQWCRPSMAPAALPGRLPNRLPLKLVRSAEVADATVLMTTLEDFAAWAIDAPQVRLKRLVFAASDDGRAVVRGTPLPPIAGVRYVERQGVAVPAGWELRPKIDAATVHAILLTDENDLAIFAEDGSWERIDADQFTAATRSAARATQAQTVNVDPG